MATVSNQRMSARAGAARIRAAQSRLAAATWILLGILAAALLAVPRPAHGQALGVQRLLHTATTSEDARYVASARLPALGVARQKPVQLDVRRLFDQQKAAPADISVDLFDADTVTLTPERLERRGEGNYTWHGKLKDHPNGFAMITVVDGNVSGMIELGDNSRGARTRYQLQSTSDGLTLLQEIDSAAFPEDHPATGELVAPVDNVKPLFGATNSSKGVLANGVVEKADTAAIIDVMIVYSNQTAAAAGAGIGAQAQQAVDTANLVYANSGITTRLRLVYAGPANYDESGDFNTDLNRLTNGADGYMDGVAALRDAYGADLVSLFVENAQYCGLGWVGPNAGYGFSVINRGCASSNLSYPHELGHNFGARHDTYVDTATTPYAYGHGWVDTGQRWRDVMAYNNACAAYGFNCTRIPYMSNPALTYGSPADPLGSTTTANVARVHNDNALTVANFRASKQGGATSCTFTVAPASASVGAGFGSGSVGVTTQSGCAWNAASNAVWLSAGSSATGSGTLAYSYAANSGPARSGTLNIGGVAFNVMQASGCAFTLGTTSAVVPSTGGSGTTTLATGGGCPWTAASSATWLAVSSATSGSGGTTVSYAAAVNTGAARSANLTIGGQTFIVSQAAATATAPVATISVAAMNFGSVMVGKTSGAKTATVKNSGGGTLTIGSLTLGGANAVEFSRAGTCAVGTSLAAGASCTLSLTFRPLTIGARVASLSVGTSSGSGVVTLSGTGKKAGR